jgi:hypothetical protein
MNWDFMAGWMAAMFWCWVAVPWIARRLADRESET